MIKSFGSPETQRLWERKRVKKFEAIQRPARRKLELLNGARKLSDLGALPGNRIEPLHGDREGQHSIRINDQYRIRFVWDGDDNDAYQVEITDYH